MPSRRRRAVTLLALVAVAMLAGPRAWAVEIMMSATVDTPPRPLVRGVTNLPDGAVLSVELDRADGTRLDGATTTVKGGLFTAGPFSRGGQGLDAGEYAVGVLMEMPPQPSEVRRVLGRHGMEMQGPLLLQRSSGQIVSYRLAFTVAGSGAAGAATTDTAAPGPDAWASDSCRSRLAFLNRAVHDNKVSGHEIMGAEARAWLDDCVRSMQRVPRSEPELP